MEKGINQTLITGLMVIFRSLFTEEPLQTYSQIQHNLPFLHIIYIYVYVCVCVCVCDYIYIYIYIHRF